VTRVVIASDSPFVLEEVRAVIDTAGTEVREVRTGGAVLTAVAEEPPELVILDFQIGNMGGVAVCLDLRLEESGGRIPHVPVLMLLDRRADVFLARRSNAESWVVKPLDPIRLRRAIATTLEGGSFHDQSFRPPSVGTEEAAG
jgi:DNA-binding response OmpR family regulator